MALCLALNVGASQDSRHFCDSLGGSVKTGWLLVDLLFRPSASLCLDYRDGMTFATIVTA